MNANIQRIVIIGSLGATTYLIATCPCEQMGGCKKELFLGLTAIPFGFALYNFMGEGTCPAK